MSWERDNRVVPDSSKKKKQEHRQYVFLQSTEKVISILYFLICEARLYAKNVNQ